MRFGVLAWYQQVAAAWRIGSTGDQSTLGDIMRGAPPISVPGTCRPLTVIATGSCRRLL